VESTTGNEASAALRIIDGADANPHRDAEALRERLGRHPEALPLSRDLATHAASSAALGPDSSTPAVPDSTTISPPFASPRKFNILAAVPQEPHRQNRVSRSCAPRGWFVSHSELDIDLERNADGGGRAVRWSMAYRDGLIVCVDLVGAGTEQAL
jgi:hypothetical protein